MNRASGWLQVVCIFAIILGVLGVLMGLFGLASLAAGPAIQKSLTPELPFEDSPEFEVQMEMQQKMQQRMQEVANRWMFITGPLLIAEFIVSLCLIIGAVKSLRLRPGGRTLLVFAFWAAILVELIQLVPTIAVQHETAGITAEFMSKMMEASTPDGGQMPPNFKDAAPLMGKMMFVMGVVFAVGLTLVQTAFYLFGAIYLRRPRVRELFVEPAMADFA
ncbi:MAG: hypothetical protein JW888_16125 [Pirellulales bacterium]|nr:hypothetical protein [Pirellulales bacterium]